MSELPKGMSQKKFNDLPTTRAIIYSILSDEGVESKIEYKVGQSVSVYAPKKGRKGVDENDLWYGIIECIRVDKRPKASQPFWVKIRWYWSNDFQEQSFQKASQLDPRFFAMGTRELLQSDLTQWSEASIIAGIIHVVKFNEKSGLQKPWSWDGLYTRWYTSSLPPKLQDDSISLSCIPICNKPFSPDKETQRFCLNCNRWYHTRCLPVLEPAQSFKSRLPSIEVNPGFTDQLFKALLCCPIERGITAGVSGNGWTMSQVRAWYHQLVIKGHPLPHDWIIQLDQVDPNWIIPTKKLSSIIYYQCPTCPTYWL